MPEEEHKLTIQIETNAKQAAKDIEELDKAQKNAADSGDALQETSRRGSTADARRIRLRARYIKQYLRDIQAVRQNTEKTSKAIDGLRSRERGTGRETTRWLDRSANSSNLLFKRLLAVAGVMTLIKRGVQQLGEGLDFGKNYALAGMLTGTDAVKAQMWKLLLQPYGGNLGTATGSLQNLQRNIELANMGEMPFNDMAFRLLGDSIITRPGMTQEEFLRNIAPRMQALSRGQALLAGQAVGITPDMALLLHEKGAGFAKELEKQREAAALSQKEAEEARKNRAKLDKIRENYEGAFTKIATKLLDLIPDDPKVLKDIGEAARYVTEAAKLILELKALKWLLGLGAAKGAAGAGAAGAGAAGATGGGLLKAYLFAKALLFNPLTAAVATAAVPIWLQTLTAGDIVKKIRTDPKEEKKQNKITRDAFKGAGEDAPGYDFYSNYGAFNTNTPLNFMPVPVAWQMGARAGGGDKVLNLGGITINAPSGNAEDIAESVVKAGDVVLAAFADLDRTTAGRYTV